MDSFDLAMEAHDEFITTTTKSQHILDVTQEVSLQWDDLASTTSQTSVLATREKSTWRKYRQRGDSIYFGCTFPSISRYSGGVDTCNTAARYLTLSGENYDHFYFPAIGVLLCLGVTGNAMVIVQSIRDKELHSPTFAIIGSVAFADLMFLVIRIPVELLFKYSDDWILGDIVCRLYMYFLQCVAYSEAYHLVLLAIVRYYQLTHPLDAYTRLTTKKTLRMSAFLWLFLFVALSPILAFTGERRYFFGPDDNTGQRMCFLTTQSKAEQRAYFLCYSVFCYFLPLLILVVFHVGKALGVRRVTKLAKKKKGSVRVMSITVASILILFGFLLAPVHTNNVLVITETTDNNPLVHVISKLMAYTNSVINPFVYALCAKKFRDSFLSCLPTNKKGNHRQMERGRVVAMTDSSNATMTTSK